MQTLGLIELLYNNMLLDTPVGKPYQRLLLVWEHDQGKLCHATSYRMRLLQLMCNKP